VEIAVTWDSTDDVETWLEVIFPDVNVMLVDVQKIIGPEFEMHHTAWLCEPGDAE
jgi:hypothetical protein